MSYEIDSGDTDWIWGTEQLLVKRIELKAIDWDPHELICCDEQVPAGIVPLDKIR